ncbi:restriction endonuclease subunit S [Pseudoalteromonas simplex]|uniref:restriction endonuclease subunit S n=1 Tax=Pseudoalteromonas simplex TaxID=2783613 RepID=UPI00188936D0|nr:restriction endonuclease subunit S [Pseudoalteromonas sp. A520]|tara:strand:+ start:1805 stop:3115 length:1311 start_codon:yes stop_codon:yes gene_type:complete
MAINFPIVKLGSLVKIKGGKRLPKGKQLQTTKNSHPYIRVRDMGEKYIPDVGLEYVPDDVFPNIKNYIVHENDVIISIVGTIGLVSLIDSRFHLASQTENCAKLSGLDEVDAQYLFYYLNSPMGKAEIFKGTVGAVQAKLPLYAIENLDVIWPSRRDRENIVLNLESVDSKISLNRKTNQTLEQMAQALFKSWFVDFDPVIDNALAAGNNIPEALQHKAEQRLQAQQLPDFKPLPDDIRALFPSEFEQTDDPSIGIAGWIPKGWSSIYLSDLLDVKYGKDHKKLDEGEYPVYGSGGLMRRVDKFLYEGESVLIPRKGTLSNIMYVNETFWSVDTMFFTIPKLPNVAKFTFYLLKRLNFDNMNVGSAVPSMTTKVLNALPVVCPSESVLAKFDEIMDLYFSKIQANQASTNQLEQLRDTLLPKLISGEITLPNKDVA